MKNHLIMVTLLKRIFLVLLLSTIVACGGGDEAITTSFCDDCKIIPPVESITGPNGEERIDPNAGVIVNFSVPIDEPFSEIVSFYIEDENGNKIAVTFE